MKFITILKCFYWFCVCNVGMAKTIIHVDKFEFCYINPKSGLVVEEINVVNPKGDNAVVRGHGRFERDIPPDSMRLSIIAVRCPNRDVLDSCEKFAVLKPPNTCHFLAMRKTAWESFVYGFEPPFKCPLKKGPIIARNVSFDPDLFNLFQIDKYYWRLNLEVYEKKEKLLTICLEASIIPYY